MKVAKIFGGNPLHGTVAVSGSKNSSLAILAATLLTSEPCIISNIPDVVDVNIVIEILRAIGVDVEKLSANSYKFCAKNIIGRVPEELYLKTRGAISIAGALLSRLGEAEIFLPGGCAIGPRPIDLHLEGFRNFGCEVTQNKNRINIDAHKAHSNTMFLGSNFGSTVTGTVNMILAASGINGETVIEGAACEPEIVDLCKFLLKIGVNLSGIGTTTITIVGNQKLHGCTHNIISDRIEAGTFICAGLITRGELQITCLERHMLGSMIHSLQLIGANVEENIDGIFVKESSNLQNISIVTLPFPGFPTDLQAQMATLLTQGKGVSYVTERVYPNRFYYVKELQKLGADIRLKDSTAIINCTNKQFIGTTLEATDLRASASLYLAGLIAKDMTTVTNLHNLDRGYDHFEEKLQSLGADIVRCNA